MNRVISTAVSCVLTMTCLAACGAGSTGGVDEDTGKVSPPDSTETYEVTGPATWSMTANGIGFDTIIFSHTGERLWWVTYNSGSGGAGIQYLIWSSVLLKYPITQGETWSETGGSNGYTVETATVVEDTDAEVTVKAGMFTSCVVTTETFSVDSAYNKGAYIAEYRRYFAPAVGLVKVVDTWHTGEVTTGELVEYVVHEPDPDDYFPLAAGDRWKFEWTTN